MYIKHERKYSGDILISKNFITDYMDKISKKAVSIYLTIVMYSSAGGEVGLDHISKILGISEDDVLDELSVMNKIGLIKIKGDTVLILDISGADGFRSDIGYTPEEIAGSDDKKFSMMRNAVEKSFSKMLSAREVNKLAEIVEGINLPAEVLVLVVEYVASSGKKTLNAIEKNAVVWAEKGIDTTARAHEYLNRLEITNRLIETIKIRFYAIDRAFSKKDRDFIEKWTNDFTEEEIIQALEKTINSISKLSFAYADSILYPKQGSNLHKEITGVKKSKFNNFSHKSVDYKEIENRAMQKLMNRRKKGE